MAVENETSGADSPHVQLAWEAGAGRTASIAAGLAGLLTLGGVLWTASIGRTAPVGNDPATLRFIHDHAGAFFGARAMAAVGTGLIAVVAWYLYRATRYRKPEAQPPVVLYVGVLGPIVTAVAAIVPVVALTFRSATYTKLEFQTLQGADAMLHSTAMTVAGYATLVGMLAMGFWFVLGSLNAMRVGLLTRSIGILGISLGPLMILAGPVLPIQVLLAFWLIALAALFVGYWPGGRPESWITGTAVPWPSAAERASKLAEERKGDTDDSFGTPRDAIDGHAREADDDRSAGWSYGSQKADRNAAARRKRRGKR